ncbi:UDP-glycosyltransferase 87A1-like [Pyrus ussuriensis x Pyrus communis]|uniref:UDP-glycosyltransferase 87A1-like n=1 Tax=Pyrus ussuriensis x Pyrus communis TaxID=2448454 RepID=A0A5N5G193_9ROSA|nr:UDP-glycosyltransferase 87A1-like [Pyrus ussuriensis x Pyrus communis]
MGSFLSVSSVQMDEIAAGLRKSGVQFIWTGFVPGGVSSHCGWNSVTEGVFAGASFLTLAILFDQGMNSNHIVEDWRVGWRVRKVEDKIDHLVTREEIAGLVKKFMDLEDDEGMETRRARELKQLCHDAIAEGVSSHTNIKAFIRHFAEGVRED